MLCLLCFVSMIKSYEAKLPRTIAYYDMFALFVTNGGEST
jgi:hypothetical protein